MALDQVSKTHCDSVLPEVKEPLGCWVNSSPVPPTCTLVSCTYSQLYFFFDASTHTWISPPTFHLPSNQPSLLKPSSSPGRECQHCSLRTRSSSPPWTLSQCHGWIYKCWSRKLRAAAPNGIKPCAKVKNKWERAALPKECHHLFHQYSSSGSQF